MITGLNSFFWSYQALRALWHTFIMTDRELRVKCKSIHVVEEEAGIEAKTF